MIQAIMGVIMLLLGMLPFDVRHDFIGRLHEMSAQESQDREQATTAGSEGVLDPAANPDDVLPEGELSGLFEE